MKIELIKKSNLYTSIQCVWWRHFLLLTNTLPFLLLLILLKLFTNNVALAQNNIAETKTDIKSTENSFNTISIETAINHAKVFYDIAISVDNSLLTEQVPAWTNKHIPEVEWTQKVFKNFDKAIQYDENGKITELKIIDFKTPINRQPDSDYNIPGTAIQTQGRSASEYNTIENATSIITRDPDMDPELDTVLSIKPNQNNELPEGVTIHNTPSSQLDSQEANETFKDLIKKPSAP